MSLSIQGICLGNIRENHCSLFHTTDRLRELSPIIETLWDDSFNTLSNAEIFGLIDRARYTGEPTEHGPDYRPFDFLTNTGEQFDDVKTFIVCRPDKRVCILYQRGGTIGSGSCSAQTFRSVVADFVHWFDEQVRATAPPFFPINPFDPNEEVPDDRNG